MTQAGLMVLMFLGATQDFKVVEKNAVFSVWAREMSIAEPLLPRLKTGLTNLLTHEVLKDRLPTPFAILIDETLKSTMGFHSHELRSPDDEKAILIHPQAIELDRSLRTLLHELVHLAHEKARPKEESWVREGLALTAEYWVLGKINSVYRLGLKEPETSLVAEIVTNLEKNRGQEILWQYGHIALFFSYAFRHCGREKLLMDLLYNESKQTGLEFLNERLKARASESTLPNFCRDFSALFQQFQWARFTQSPTSADSYVVITSIDTTVRDEKRELLPYSASAYKAPSTGCVDGGRVLRDRVCLEVREN